MIKINTKVLDFEEVVTNLNHSTIWLMATELHEVRVELEIQKEMIVQDTFNFGDNVDEIKTIEKQLYFINKNLNTLEIALEYCETKITEHRIGLNDLQLIFLN